MSVLTVEWYFFVLFKFVKLILSFSVVFVIGYCVVQNNSTPIVEQIKHSVIETNATKQIKYSKQFRGGTLDLRAASAKLLPQDKVLLTGMKAFFCKDGRVLTINCGECCLNSNEQKAYLSKCVCIKSPDTICNTDRAVIDFPNNSISGDSKMSGRRAGVDFVSDGFFMDERGMIKLVRASMKKIG